MFKISQSTELNRVTKPYELGVLSDLAVIIAILVAVKQIIIPISILYAGPVSTLSAMCAASYMLYRRNLRWADLGFKMPENWLKTIAWTALTLLVIKLTASLTSVVAGYEPESIGDSGRFQHVEGDWLAYITIMIIVWTHGSFFEELLFRAFMINRLSRFFGGTLKGDILAVIISSVFFGYRHYYYQGFAGALQSGAIGLSLGVLYIGFGRRNILPLIFAHGIVNSLSQTANFLGEDSFFDD